jgi:hypothetical protein
MSAWQRDRAQRRFVKARGKHERTKLERGETVVIEEDRPTAQLEALVVHAAKVGGHVDIAVPIRASQAARLNAIADGCHVRLRNVSRVVVK